MTTARIRVLERSLLLCALLCSCNHDGAAVEKGARAGGGQAGDDGAPLHEDADVPHAGTGAPEPDIDGGTGPDVRQPQFEVVHTVVLDGPIELICAAGLAPNDAAIAARDRAEAAPYFCLGWQGRWSCTCDGETATSYAAQCIGALRERCGVTAEALIGADVPPPDTCAASLPMRAGQCSAHEQSIECTCEGSDETIASDDRTCERALWSACARPCENENDYGSCQPHAGGFAGEYECSCSYRAGGPRRVLGSGCDDALFKACDLRVDDGLGCNGYGGFCERQNPADPALQCSCADGSEHAATIADGARHAACRTALEETCGTGDPGLETLCVAEGNDYTARCTQPPGDAAPYLCECVRHGLDGDELVSAMSLPGTSCDGLLSAICPQVEAVDASDRERVCDYYARCEQRYVGFDAETCPGDAPDACVACTSVALDARNATADTCPERVTECVGACAELVPKELAVAACERSVEAMSKLDAQSRCLCDRCHPAFGQCMADEGCIAILSCAEDTGCTQSTCEQDPICGPIVMQYYSTRSLSLALEVGSCEARDACAELAGDQ